MRILEIISENVHNPSIDWEKFGIALAAYSTTLGPDGSPDFKGVDAIILLGLAGDPNSQSVLDVRYKRPVKVGVTQNDQGNREMEFNLPKQTIAGQYFTDPYTHKGDTVRQYTAEYQIILNYRHFDVARVNQGQGGSSTELLAHEAAHRGFDILKKIPAIHSKLSSKTKYYMDYLMTYGEEIPGLGLENTGERLILEEMLIYSVLNPEYVGPSTVFRSKEEVRKFQRMYEDFENAASQYLSNYQVSVKGLASLQKELNKHAPDGVSIKITPSVDGTLQVIGVNARAALAWIKKQTEEIKTQLLDKEHVVVAGETLGKIAQKYKISTSELIKNNPQISNPNLIEPGDKITIPDSVLNTIKREFDQAKNKVFDMLKDFDVKI